MKVIRVFPRKTRATPSDPLVRFDGPGMFPDDEADEIHVSVTFYSDMKRAEWLASQWRGRGTVKIGGPATGGKSGPFVAGMYLKRGYTITSRGCPNSCWFCDAWRREGHNVREYPFPDGYNVLDDNLLACSDSHIRQVYDMLGRQRRRPEFTGGLEARRLRPWHCDSMRQLKPKTVFFAYDTPDDYEPLRQAARMMIDAGFTIASHVLRCYVLCGWPGDSVEKADKRMRNVLCLGMTPMAMAWRGRNGQRLPMWAPFQRRWAKPVSVHGGIT